LNFEGEAMTFKHAVAGVAVLLMGSVAWGSVTKAPWGKTSDGKAVEIFTISDHDLTVRITTFGARVVSIEAPDRNGKMADVVLGYDNVGQYEKDKTTYFGSIVGRYGNRIAKGTFSIDGKTFHIPLNNNGNALHGGPGGFSTLVWTGTEIPDGVEMSLVSPDGDMGFPGTLTVHVRYTVVEHSLRISYSATTTKATVTNLTNHSYFNLAGQTGGTILDHEMMIAADQYTAADDAYIPTGELKSVKGTPLDFTSPKAIGARIGQIKGEPGGYDHNYVIRPDKKSPALAARVREPNSGRVMEVFTTEPGVQLYTGNFLDGSVMGKGVVYKKHTGFCLETQHFPDSPHHPEFPPIVLRPGATYKTTTIYKFSAP
jgi:aldose 1-epimerase